MSWKPNFKMASYFGNLKMERVIKDENDERKTGSLVFRIKRTLPETNDDSGIKCSSPSSEEMSSEEKVESCPSPIKVRIPKALFDEAESVMELSRNGCNSTEDIALTSNNKNWDILSDKSLKKADVDSGNVNTMNYIPETEVKFCKKTRHKTSKIKIPIELRRRSRRIDHLRLLKECQKSLSIDASNMEDKDDIHEHKGAVCLSIDTSNREDKDSIDEQKGADYDSNRIVPAKILKKRKKRKVVFKDVEPKKKKYARRGRPPKSAIQSNFGIEQPFISPVSSGSDEANTTALFPPLKNSVWTLVPKSLFESDFFKSQVLEVRPIEPQTRFTAPNYFSPPTIAQTVPSVSNTRIRLKYPKNFVNPVPAIRPKMLEDKSSKRPTVIYFKKSFNTHFTNQAITNNIKSEVDSKTTSTKINTDLLYLFNKYRMLDGDVVRNFYELNKRNINETDSMLSDLFSRILHATSDEKIASVYVKQETSPNNCVSETGSTEAAPSSYETADIPPRPCTDFKDTDTLCTRVIVESLNILYSEEAVLQ